MLLVRLLLSVYALQSCDPRELSHSSFSLYTVLCLSVCLFLSVCTSHMRVCVRFLYNCLLFVQSLAACIEGTACWLTIGL